MASDTSKLPDPKKYVCTMGCRAICLMLLIILPKGTTLTGAFTLGRVRNLPRPRLSGGVQCFADGAAEAVNSVRLLNHSSAAQE